MSAALVLNVIGFANYAAVLPDVLADTGFSEAEAGLAGGLFFLAYALGSPVFAVLTDTYPPRRLYVIGCVIGASGGLLFPLMDDGYAALLLSRTLSGLGMAGAYMPGLRLLIESVPPDHQSRATSVYVSTLTLGLSASFAVSGLLQLLFGWQAAFLGATAAASAAALLVLASMSSRTPTPSQDGLAKRVRSVLRRPAVGLVLAAVGGNSWEGMAFRIWWMALLAFAVGNPGNDAFSGLNLALATAFTGLLAMPLSTWVAGRAEAGRRHRVIAIAAASAVLVAGVLALTIDGPFPWVFAISILYACAIFSDAGSLPPTLMRLVEPTERGAALALMAAVSNFAAFLAIIACGFTLDGVGDARSAVAWQAAIAVMAAGSAVVVAAMLILDRSRAATSRQAGGTPACPAEQPGGAGQDAPASASPQKEGSHCGSLPEPPGLDPTRPAAAWPREPSRWA